MANVVTNFASDDKEVIAAIDKMNKKLGELQEKNRQLAEDSKAASAASKKGADGALASLGKMAVGYLSVQTAVELVNQSLRDQIDLQNKAAQKQLGAAPGEREFLTNLGASSVAEQNRALARKAALSQRVGIPESQLDRALSSALSASGGNENVAFGAVEDATKISRRAEEIELLSGAFIDLGKAFDQLDPKRGAEMLLEISKASRITNLQSLAANAPQGIAGATASGFTPGGAASLYEALSNAMSDRVGARTSTAESALAARLRAFAPEEDVYEGEGRKRTLKHKGVGPMSGEDRMMMIANDPAMRQAFIDSLEVSESKPFVEKLMTPGTKEYAMFADRMAARKAGPAVNVDAFGKQLDQTPLQRQEKLDRELESVVESDLLKATGKGRASIIFNRTEEAMAAAGVGSSVRLSHRMKMRGREMMGVDPATAARMAVEEEFASRSVGRGAGFENEVRGAMPGLSRLEKVLIRIEQNQKAAGAGNKVEGR